MYRLMIGLFAVALLCTATNVSAESSQDKIAQLEARIAQLESQQQTNWLDEKRAEEVKDLVREVLADAETRASMLEGGMQAGHDGKFFLQSADGTFRLQIEGQIQFRYVANFRDNSGDDDGLAGFQLRRGKLKFGGHIGTPKFKYKVTLASDRGNGNVYLEEIYVAHKLEYGVTITGGRFKPHFLREENISSSVQLASERSFINERFTWGFSEGIEAAYEEQDLFHIYVAINDGREQGESGTQDFHQDGTDIGVSARVDFKILGADWSKAKEFTSVAADELVLFAGAGIAFQTSETGGAPIAGDNRVHDLFWTIDALVKYQGISGYAAFVGRHMDYYQSGATMMDTQDFGLVLQGGYRFYNDQIEPFVRYEYFFADNDHAANGSAVDDLQMFTFGANYYIHGHKAKLTADVVWALDPVWAAESGLGLLQDAANEDNQMVLRIQFQLLF